MRGEVKWVQGLGVGYSSAYHMGGAVWESAVGLCATGGKIYDCKAHIGGNVEVPRQSLQSKCCSIQGRNI